MQINLFSESQYLGIKGSSFLKIGTSPQVEGMGSSYVSISENNINSIYYNPAGLGSLRNMTFLFSYLDWIDNVSINYLSFATPSYKLKGVISSSLTFLSLSPIIHYNDWGENIGSLYFYNLAFTGGYARSFRGFDTGVNVKMLYQKIADKDNLGVAFDLGGIFKFDPFSINLFNKLLIVIRKFNFGLAIKNIGTKAGADSLPTSIEFGYSFLFMKDLLFSTTMVKPFYYWESLMDSDYKVNFGLEYLFYDTVFLRTGYKLNYEIPNNFTLGFGIKTRFKYGLIFVDYSYASYTYLEKTHCFSVTMRLHPIIPEKSPAIPGKEIQSPPEEDYRIKNSRGFTNE